MSVKRAKIRFLQQAVKQLILFFLLLTFLGAAFADTEEIQLLSNDEKAWLKKNAAHLQLWFNDSFPPLEFSDSNQEFTGLGADIIRSIEKEIGFSFPQVLCHDWNRHLAALHTGECAIAPTIVENEERARYAYFSSAYAQVPVVIISTLNSGSKKTLRDFAGKKVAAVAGYATEGYLKDFKEAKLEVVTVSDVTEGLQAVAFGQVDAYIENLAVASYYISHHGISNLKVVGTTDFNFVFRIAVSKKYPLLFSAIQKGLARIAPEELAKARKQWITLRVEHGMSSETVQLLKIAGVFLVVLIFSLLLISILLKRNLNDKMIKLQAAQKEALNNEFRFRSLFMQAPLPLVELDSDNRVLSLNNSFEETFGYRVEDSPTIDDWWPQAYPDPADRQDAMERWAKAIATSENGRIRAEEYEVTCKNGEKKKIMIGASIIGDRLLATFFNITERIKAEQALRQNEENLRVTLDALREAVIATDMRGIISRINPAAEKLTGWKADAAIGKPISEIYRLVDPLSHLPIENPVSRFIDAQVDSEPTGNALLLAADHKEYLINSSCAPIKNDAHELIGLVLVFRDITEEQTLQEQLRQSQKMDAIGQLAGGIAHDFNNMLAGIIGAAELLQTLPQQETKAAGYIRTIIEASNRASYLTAKLLAFARKQPVHLSPLNVLLPLREAVELFQRTVDKRIKITFETTEENLPITGDFPQLQSAFLNLLLNSSQAMPEGGIISISAQKIYLEKPFLASSQIEIAAGHYARLEVNDTGCGIPARHLPHIFEPFFTTKAPGKGTGLGLAAVFGTMQQHSGAIDVCSQPGAGASFRLFFPIITQKQTAEKNNSGHLVSGSGTVMLVDDEPMIRFVAGNILSELGYKTIEAENGLQAAELFRKHHESVSLVVLDMVMPGMNGKECFFELKKIDPAVKVLVSSGFSGNEDVETMKEAGARWFIRKPFTAAELSQAIAEAIRS